MSFTDPPISATAISSFLALRNLSHPEPIDCTTPPVLDLCTRRKSCSPKPEGARHSDSLDQFRTSPPIISTTNLPHSEIESSEDGSVMSDHIQEYSSLQTLPSMIPKTKISRPFKAYPKDPFFLAIGASTADALLGQESAEAYAEFRKKMLSQVRANNPQPGVTNPKMRRSNLPTSNQDCNGKDASYWEKRKKNNEAAKRSRDARRAKEDEIAIRAAFLEQENLKLKYEVAALRNETAKLRCLLYN